MDALRARRVRERLRHRRLEVFESLTLDQRVQEVVGDVGVTECGGDVVRLAGVACDDLDAVAPRVVAEAFGTTSEDAHGEARVQQFGHQASTDVAGRAGD